MKTPVFAISFVSGSDDTNNDQVLLAWDERQLTKQDGQWSKPIGSNTPILAFINHFTLASCISIRNLWPLWLPLRFKHFLFVWWTTCILDLCPESVSSLCIFLNIFISSLFSKDSFTINLCRILSGQLISLETILILFCSCYICFSFTLWFCYMLSCLFVFLILSLTLVFCSFTV